MCVSLSAFVCVCECVCGDGGGGATSASGYEGLSKQSESRPSESPLWGSTVRVTAAIIWLLD